MYSAQALNCSRLDPPFSCFWLVAARVLSGWGLFDIHNLPTFRLHGFICLVFVIVLSPFCHVFDVQ